MFATIVMDIKSHYYYYGIHLHEPRGENQQINMWKLLCQRPEDKIYRILTSVTGGRNRRSFFCVKQVRMSFDRRDFAEMFATLDVRKLNTEQELCFYKSLMCLDPQINSPSWKYVLFIFMCRSKQYKNVICNIILTATLFKSSLFYCLTWNNPV